MECDLNWGNEIQFDFTKENSVNKDTVFLFEILDIDFKSEDFIRKVAWGYLLPIGSLGVH